MRFYEKNIPLLIFKGFVMKIKLIFLIIILFCNFLDAQYLDFSSKIKPSSESELFRNIERDVNVFVNSSKKFLLSPFNLKQDDLTLTGIILGSTLLSFSFDKTVRVQVKKIKSAQWDSITDIGEKWGNSKYGTMLSGILYTGGHLTGNKKIRETGIMLAQALFINGLITKALKMTIGRSRPHQQFGNIDFQSFTSLDQRHSLPSGHTSTAFVVSTVLSEQINNIYASIFLYSLAGLTAFQRSYSDNHWFSDTVLGAAVGILVGLKVVSLHKKSDKSERSRFDLNIEPVIKSTGTGIGLSLNF